MTGLNERFIRVTVEAARNMGIDWNARYMYIGDGKKTVDFLERMLKKMKKEVEKDG